MENYNKGDKVIFIDKDKKNFDILNEDSYKEYRGYVFFKSPQMITLIFYVKRGELIYKEKSEVAGVSKEEYKKNPEQYYVKKLGISKGEMLCGLSHFLRKENW